MYTTAAVCFSRRCCTLPLLFVFASSFATVHPKEGRGDRNGWPPPPPFPRGGGSSGLAGDHGGLTGAADSDASGCGGSPRTAPTPQPRSTAARSAGGGACRHTAAAAAPAVFCFVQFSAPLPQRATTARPYVTTSRPPPAAPTACSCCAGARHPRSGPSRHRWRCRPLPRGGDAKRMPSSPVSRCRGNPKSRPITAPPPRPLPPDAHQRKLPPPESSCEAARAACPATRWPPLGAAHQATAVAGATSGTGQGCGQRRSCRRLALMAADCPRHAYAAASLSKRKRQGTAAAAAIATAVAAAAISYLPAATGRGGEVKERVDAGIGTAGGCRPRVFFPSRGGGKRGPRLQGPLCWGRPPHPSRCTWGAASIARVAARPAVGRHAPPPPRPCARTRSTHRQASPVPLPPAPCHEGGSSSSSGSGGDGGSGSGGGDVPSSGSSGPTGRAWDPPPSPRRAGGQWRHLPGVAPAEVHHRLVTAGGAAADSLPRRPAAAGGRRWGDPRARHAAGGRE